MLEQTNMFKGFIGQTFICNMLYDMFVCTQQQHTAFPHTLFIASAGQGKTYLSRKLGKALSPNMFEVFGPSIKSWDDMQIHLQQLTDNSNVLFIDEIHALPTNVQELLYLTMTDYKYVNSKTGCYVTLPKFTLLGATTDPQYMLRPFRDRFVNTMVFQKYTKNDLYNIFEHGWYIEKYDTTVVNKIIALSHGVPRKLNALLKRLNFYIIANKIPFITPEVFETFMQRIGIDDYGMNPLQQQYLQILKQANSPVSLANLANLMELKQEVITDIVEPDIISADLVTITSAGRKYKARKEEICQTPE